MAVAYLCGNPDYAQFDSKNLPRACDWSTEDRRDLSGIPMEPREAWQARCFNIHSARALLEQLPRVARFFSGLARPDLPRCPLCGMMVEQALMIREEAAAEVLEAKRAAEREAAKRLTTTNKSP